MAAILDFLKMLKGVAITPVGFLIRTPLSVKIHWKQLCTTFFPDHPNFGIICLD